ncbi:mitochondrial ribosome-associated GTPase 2 [Bacillus rossius redtenbacheri]|uniref:mitochondrial ribosome-associated GTPase 2 n=1 Tax=Bacillus rossius redtenbacheri TaxID=93214 RepID=UPI002FDCC1F7
MTQPGRMVVMGDVGATWYCRTVVADLQHEGCMFVAARGGAGGHGNHFFTSDTLQSPKVAECGAEGEQLDYVLELSSMANVGLIGLPNAGKSTLLRAISRARPKVASYPFTTLKPHVGIVQYDDYEQVAVADLPGLIEGSHKNRGLGIAFLKHAERCAVLVYVVDASCDKPWTHLWLLQHELGQFCKDMLSRSQLVVCNKVDLPGAQVRPSTLGE